MIATVTLNPSLDYIVQSKKLMLGGITRTENEAIYPGGKGINVSVMLASLGMESCALGFSAGFTGREIEERLRQHGCRVSMIEVKDGFSRINVKIHAEEESEINGRGPMITEADVQQLLQSAASLHEDDWLVLAGSIPSGLPKDFYARLIQHTAAACIVDAEGEALRSVLPFRPFLIKPNVHELSQLCGKELSGRREIEEAARSLQQQGARHVLVSMAGEGALLLTEDGQSFFRAPNRGTVVNSVGAGDSMVAGFLAGWLMTGQMERALELGTACGSATAFTTWIAGRDQVAAQLQDPAVFGLMPQRRGHRGEAVTHLAGLEGEHVWVELEPTGLVCCAGAEEAPLELGDLSDWYQSGVFQVQGGMLVSAIDPSRRLHPFNSQILGMWRWMEEE